MFRQLELEKFMRFPEGKCKAATFSYDDGVEADIRLIKLFDKYGLKGTFNLNSNRFDAQCWNNRLDEKRLLKTFCCCNHEIAMHGATHVFLNKVSLPEAVNEIVQNRLWLETHFERVVQGMAYAYNAYNEDILGVIGSLGVKYARTCDSTHAFSLPENWLKLNPTCHHDDPELFDLLQKFISADPNGEKKLRDPLLFYVWGHSYEFDKNGNWDRMENIAKTLSQSKDIWFATNGEICDYVKAYQSLIFSIDGGMVKNPSYMGVWLDFHGKTHYIEPGEEKVL